MTLRLGVVGLSEGNGHPYSWSAIFNGYEVQAMEACGFPSIPRYLEQQVFPRDAISSACVTHVWAQQRSIARHIAEACRIEHVADRLTDLIGAVDAVLLARDDADRHWEMSVPFLDAGIPIYIDKPLAHTVAEAQRLFERQRYPGQLFTCSALRYASEFRLDAARESVLGRITHAYGMVPKDWGRYAVHVIEPLLLLGATWGHERRTAVWRDGGTTVLCAAFTGGVQAVVSSLGTTSSPIAIRLMGESGMCDMVFADTFAAFRTALQDFVAGVVQRDVRIEPRSTLAVIQMVEAGLRSGE